MAASAVKEFKVLTSAIHVYLDAEAAKAKATVRKLRGEIVKIDPAFNDVDRLVSLGAISEDLDAAPATSSVIAAASQQGDTDGVPADQTPEGQGGEPPANQQ